MKNRTLLFVTTAFAASLLACTSKATVSPDDGANVPSPPTAPPTPTAAPSASEEPHAEAPTMREAPIAAGKDFATNLHAQVARRSGNFAVSPPNLKVVLAEITLGARGETRDELVKTLALPASQSAQIAAAKKESAAWTASAGKAQFTSATRIWTDLGSPALPSFLKDVKSGFGAEPKALDFRNQTEPARLEINAWAKEHTGGLIPELLGAGVLTPLTRMVATSALYFKAQWSSQFTSSSTAPAEFKLAGDKSVQVPTMRQTASFATQSTSEFIAVRMPYKDSKLSMTVVRPAEGTSTDGVEALYVTQGVKAFTDKLSEELIDLRVPKFHFAVGGSVRGALQAMGIQTAFSERADFQAALKDPGVELADVIHKVVVKVDEEGTEAAAASAAIMAVRGMIARPKTIAFDRAFVFFIHDEGGQVLFSGRVANPKSE